MSKRWKRFSRAPGMVVRASVRRNPWSRGERRQALSMLLGATLPLALLAGMALPVVLAEFGPRDPLVPLAAWLDRAQARVAALVPTPAPTPVPTATPAPTPTPPPTPAPSPTGLAILEKPGATPHAPATLSPELQKLVDDAVAAEGGAEPGASRPPAVASLSPPPASAPPAPAAIEARREAAAKPAAPVDPVRHLKLADQLARRLGVKLEAVAPRTFRYRAPDGFAAVQLDVLGDGSAQLELASDMAFVTTDAEAKARLGAASEADGGPLMAFALRFGGEQGWWMAKRPSFALVDTFVARYMPPDAGPTREARLAWWADTLRSRVDARRQAAAEGGQAAWNPTFTLGARIGQAVLEEQTFGLVLYVPPEDRGL